MADKDTIIEGPVSYVVTRKVKPGAIKEYENWLLEVGDHLELIIRILVLIILMTFIVMPLLSRLFARWLYPASSRASSAPKD